ncbi:MAG: isoprenylcysteine carboxylmethyltransferase family protein [Candidatus Bathyarchaeota archaeon]|nr:isoprenylcysteine carboxylmethyltransferase family protein [Candidatus Bathyarchaeota archaeon]
MAYGDWIMVAVWIVLFGFFLAFIPFYKKSQRKPSSVYLAFIVALALEMFGIPLSMYIATWAIGATLAPGFLWQHTLQQYIGYTGMYIGYALNFIGIILVFNAWSRIYKGYWGKPRDEAKLVTDGIYAHIRHPQYIGFILTTLGLLVHWATIPLLIMWPILTTMYYRLAKKEEKEMEIQFGAAYLEYKAKTSMFLPIHLFKKVQKPICKQTRH